VKIYIVLLLTMLMRVRVILVSFLVLVCIGVFSFVISGVGSYQVEDVDVEYLEGLRMRAGVECLVDSQCGEGFGCVDNVCVWEGEIDICEKVNLSLSTEKLIVGSSIGSAKKTINKINLPALLSDGKIVEVVDGEVVEYFYKQFVLMGNNEIMENENGRFIDNSGEIYRYELIFSSGVDFSSDRIRGQVLEILGREYVIGKDSDNFAIYLGSENKAFRFEEGVRASLFSKVDGVRVDIIRDVSGNVIKIEIGFDAGDDLSFGEDYVNPVFDLFEISFDDDVSVGGSC